MIGALGMILAAAWAFPPEGVDADLAFVEVVAAEDFSCGRAPEGTVWCWGDGGFGQLGAGEAADARIPRKVPGLSGVVGLTAGEHHACAVARDRTVSCWGDNRSGQLGVGDTEVHAGPLAVVGLGPVLAVDAGTSHTCAVDTAGTVSCWGDNLYAQLGVPGVRFSPRPVPVAGAPAARGVAAGAAHACLIARDGGDAGQSVWCWGDGTRGALGRPAAEDLAPPGPVDGDVPAARAIHARGERTCVVHAEGAHCWGDGEPAPARTAEQKGLVAVSVGYGHACALAGDKTVTCWGADDLGQLGVRLTPPGGAAVPMAYGLGDAISVAAGRGETCAARQGAKRLVCWGSYTEEERAAAAQEKPDILGLDAKTFRQVLYEGTDLKVDAEEVLGKGGTHVRLRVTSVDDAPCANTRYDVVPEIKKRRLKLRIGDPYVPGDVCITKPAPAVGTHDLPPDASGLVNLTVRWKDQEDFYQVFVRESTVEVIPMQQTFSQWTGLNKWWRIPAGSLAISCMDHLEAPVCERRARDRMPMCNHFLDREEVAGAPSLDARKPHGNAWFRADPAAVLISPDAGHDVLRTLVEHTFTDGSGCMELSVRTWQGETWLNKPR